MPTSESILKEWVGSVVKKAIKESFLVEADLTTVNPIWIGTYAFVLAYNDGLAKGLFPRSQPLGMEFDSKIKNWSFSNGTVFANPNVGHLAEFYQSEAGHDLLHALTQNISQHFGAIPKFGKPQAKANKEILSAQDLERFIRWAKKTYQVDFDKLVPGTNNPDKREEMLARGEDILSYTSNRSFDRSMPQQERNMWGKIDSIAFQTLGKERRYFQQPFDHEGNPATKTTYNPTHAVEENMGNIVNDALARIFQYSGKIDDSTIKEILQSLVDSDDKKPEFEPTPHPENGRMTDKWRAYLTDLLPKFAALYNKRLAQLQATSFGKQYKRPGASSV